MSVIVTQNVLRKYQSKSAIREVIGCIINNPILLKDHKIFIDDFVESFHKVVIVGINNTFNNGISKLDSTIIEEYLKESFPTKYAIFKRNNGALYLDKASEMCTPENFEANYNELKKYSVLRRFLKKGIDVSEFFDPDETDPNELDKKREKFEKSDINDIIDYYKKIIMDISGEYNFTNGRDSVKAGSERARIQKEKWKNAPEIGLSYSSQYFNAVTRGIRKKRFVLGSADSGTGKTRLSISNLCFSFVPEVYNSKTQKWEKNPHGTQNSGLYIGTEMELIEEIEPILWAYIANVPEEHILFGNYLPGEEERVDRAIEILDKEANIYLEYIPDYDIDALERVIDEHVLKHKISHVFFDYIHSTTDLISEFQSNAKAKMQIREDQVLANLGNKLKNLTRKYNISIDSWTQVTGDLNNEQNRDSNVIRGAKALKDKIDVGFIASRPTIKEFKLMEKILKGPSQIGKKMPNLCYSIYKNRGGKLNKVKIWLYVDYDTMRVHDLFMTDYEYNLLPVEKLYIGVNEDLSICMANSKEELNKKLLEEKYLMNSIKEDDLENEKDKRIKYLKDSTQDIFNNLKSVPEDNMDNFDNY